MTIEKIIKYEDEAKQILIPLIAMAEYRPASVIRDQFNKAKNE